MKFNSLLCTFVLIAFGTRTYFAQSQSDSQSQIHQAPTDRYIIQISPEVSVERFLNIYPSLTYKLAGKVSFGSFQVIYGNFDTRIARYLSYSTLVLDVSRDVTVQIFDVQSNAPRHLSRLSQKERLKPWGPYDYVYDPSGGSGVDVYILDTGIQTEHPQFQNRALTGRDFTGEGPGDQNGHGTCVAGIVASESYGVAKRANLIDIKVLNSEGRGKLSWALAALEYVLQEKQIRKSPAIVNMSLGAPKNSILNKAVRQVVAQGIPVVAAAGNSDSSACRVSPASAEGALVIGAFDDRSDSIASFSNWGQCVDAFAPGVNIQSVRLMGQMQRSAASPDGDAIMYSGTSVAAPIGAGLVAYYMGMGDSGPAAVQRVKDLRVRNVLSKSTLIFKPWTENAVLYNDGGEPLW